MPPIVKSTSLLHWRERAGTLPPVLAEALHACETQPVAQAR